MESSFCRFCSEPLPSSKKELKCAACGHSSIPLTEEGISISPKEVHNMLKANEPIVVVDVRWPDEVRAAHIKGSLHIPLNQLEKKLGELPKDKEIVIYCHHGSRSRFAAIMLLCNKFANVKTMVGGIDAWSTDIDKSVARY